MPKRIILCFDGTWNTPDTDNDESDRETNVCRFYKSLQKHSSDGWEQRAWYDEGVGTKWYNRIRGGAFGLGLDRNVQQGYRHLAANYDAGDEVFIIGFSRGAYTARTLVGLIRNCGLLRRDRIQQRAQDSKSNFEDTLEDAAEEAYDIYRTRDEGADAGNAVFFRDQFSQPIRITFLGVWDTVGALGVPLKTFEWFNQRKYQFHDTELSSIVEHAYHAIAIDEHRRDYDVAMWQPKEKPQQVMEQRWFMGAHCDVGGGYEDRRLSDITLKWMQDKARACGLAFDPALIPAAADNYLGPMTDSYARFLRGLYSRRNPRFYRAIGQNPFGQEVVDESVTRRLQNDTQYRPKNTGIG